jgi:hypothetical protein
LKLIQVLSEMTNVHSGQDSNNNQIDWRALPILVVLYRCCIG